MAFFNFIIFYLKYLQFYLKKIWRKELCASNKNNHQREERQTATSLHQRPLDSLPGFTGINKEQLEGMNSRVDTERSTAPTSHSFIARKL
jgi:hypothetical protein